MMIFAVTNPTTDTANAISTKVGNVFEENKDFGQLITPHDVEQYGELISYFKLPVGSKITLQFDKDKPFYYTLRQTRDVDTDGLFDVDKFGSELDVFYENGSRDYLIHMLHTGQIINSSDPFGTPIYNLNYEQLQALKQEPNATFHDIPFDYLIFQHADALQGTAENPPLYPAYPNLYAPSDTIHSDVNTYYGWGKGYVADTTRKNTVTLERINATTLLYTHYMTMFAYQNDAGEMIYKDNVYMSISADKDTFVITSIKTLSDDINSPQSLTLTKG